MFGRSMDWYNIPGWFPLVNRVILSALIDKYKVRTVVEVGSFLGRSAAWFAQRVDMVYCVDRFKEVEPFGGTKLGTRDKMLLKVPGFEFVAGQCNDFLPVFCRNMQAIGVMHKIRPIVGDYGRVIFNVPESDLVYLDAEHGYDSKVQQIVLYQSRARKILCGDDYDRQSVKDATEDRLGEVKHFGKFWWYEQ